MTVPHAVFDLGNPRAKMCVNVGVCDDTYPRDRAMGGSLLEILEILERWGTKCARK